MAQEIRFPSLHPTIKIQNGLYEHFTRKKQQFCLNFFMKLSSDFSEFKIISDFFIYKYLIFR